MMMASMGSDPAMGIPMDHDNDGSDYHVHDASDVSGKARLAGAGTITCDENAVCSVCMNHCTNIIVLQLDVPSIGFLGLVNLKPDYAPSEISNNYMLLLRPPRLS